MKLPDRTIIATNSEYRLCVVKVGRSRRALFHKWVTNQGVLPTGSQYTTVQALVELEDGNVERVNPEDVKFVDSKQLFEQFAWGGDKEAT